MNTICDHIPGLDINASAENIGQMIRDSGITDKQLEEWMHPAYIRLFAYIPVYFFWTSQNKVKPLK